MKRSHKAAAGIVAALSLGLAATAFADPDTKPAAGQDMQHGMMGGMGHGGMEHGAMNHGAMEQMRNAKTPEERQKIAQARREEMQKRAQEHKH